MHHHGPPWPNRCIRLSGNWPLHSSVVDTWYASDLTKTYDSSVTTAQCPVISWNYADKLVAQYPDRLKYTIISLDYFPLKRLWM